MAMLIAIALNGSRPVLYGAKIGGEGGAGPGCIPIAPPRTMDWANDCRVGAPLAPAGDGGALQRRQSSSSI